MAGRLRILAPAARTLFSAGVAATACPAVARGAAALQQKPVQQGGWRIDRGFASVPPQGEQPRGGQPEGSRGGAQGGGGAGEGDAGEDSSPGKSFCKLVQDGVDRSFDVAEFEDGAADAFIDIMERFAARDIAGLQPLATQPVIDALSATWAQYDEERRHLKSLKVQAVDSVAVVGGTFLLDAEIQDVDLSLPEVQHKIHDFHFPSKPVRAFYLCLKVRYESVERCELTDKDTGAVISHMEDRRGHEWHFARLLPPELPSEELDSPWRLVHIEA